MTESVRQLVFDTETTGLSTKDGDRLIEIGIVEMMGLTLTGRTFHSYVNPEGKQIAAGAIAVHGITNDQLEHAPLFADIVEDLIEFIGDDPMIAYNAGFDVDFINTELALLGRAALANPITDALEIVRKRWPMKRMTLDAVAKRVGVDTSARDEHGHGALIDATILANVYRRLTEQDELAIAVIESSIASPTTHRPENKPVLRATVGGRLTLPRVESSYTLFASALKAESIPKIAKEAGYDAVALVDYMTTAGAMTFGDAAKKADIKAILGVALPIAISEGRPIVLYARDEQGWRNIQQLVTLCHIENEGKGLTSAQLRDHAGGIAATGGGSDGAIAHLLRTKDAETALKAARLLASLYPGAFAMEIDRHAGTPDAAVEAGLTGIAHQIGVPLIGASIARAAPGQSYLVEVLHAIGRGHDYQPEMADEEALRTPGETEALFADLPNAVGNADWLDALCDFVPQGSKPMLPRYETQEDADEEAALRRLARAGFDRHLETVPFEQHAAYEQRFAYEMGLIVGQGFAGYFLIVADFIGWAKANGIPVGPGRGSGAGSIVAWSLGITALDPLKFNLLFERFINPDRVSLPDFDVDFCENRRGEVIRYVRERYGSDRVVAIGAYGTIKAKLAVKDVGRVMGLPYGQTDKISKAIPQGDDLNDETINLPEIQEAVTSPAAREALEIAKHLQGAIRSKSRHPAGIIIADRAVSEITALERDADDPDQAVTQYDMKPVEKAGLVKFDFLGLQTLTIIERTRTNLQALGIEIDPYALPLEDAETYEALSQGHTVGVFQLEGDGITRACREIRVNNFEDIIAIGALYRPGPMEFIPLYARRKKGLEPFGTPHPLLDDVARDTYGILVYQEQVMQAAQVLAGYTLGQADLLRRAMGKKIKAEMDAQKEVFIKGCVETNKIEPERAAALFELIERFASYGFNRSHAAAYALLSYITAYLRTHYPAAFLSAALDGAVAKRDTAQAVRLAHEARRYGIELVGPDLVADGDHFKPLDTSKIRWSLTGIKGIGRTVVDAITAAAADRPFEGIEDLIARAGEQINSSNALQLAAAGAFDRICGNRHAAIAAVRNSFDGLASEAKARRQGQHSLFDDPFVVDAPDVQAGSADEKEALALERAALGLTLSAHPLDAHVSRLASEGILTPSSANTILDLAPVAMAVLIDEVVTGKNRNAWMTVRVSDEKTSLTLGCQEDLPRAHLLQEGEVVIVRVSAQITGGERRMRIDEIIGIVQPPTCRTILIQASPQMDPSLLRKILSEAPAGPDRIRITQGKHVMITPPIVTATEELAALVRSLDGVEHAIL